MAGGSVLTTIDADWLEKWKLRQAGSPIINYMFDPPVEWFYELVQEGYGIETEGRILPPKFDPKTVEDPGIGESDYIGISVKAKKMPRTPKGGWACLQKIYDKFKKNRDWAFKNKKRPMAGTTLYKTQFRVTDGRGMKTSEFVSGPRGEDIEYDQYERICNVCSQKWIASQKAKDDGDAHKERCWKCGAKNNYSEKKVNVKFRALTFPVTCLGSNETRAIVQLTGSAAKKFEKILKPGAKIEMKGWIKPAPFYSGVSQAGKQNYIGQYFLITLGSPKYKGYIKLV